MGLRDNLSKDAVQALRVREPVTIGPDQTVRQAVHAMQEHRQGCVIVVERDKPVGVFTERDVLAKVLIAGSSLDAPITEMMSSPPAVIRDGCAVAEVIRIMHSGGFRHMPVVDESGGLKGIVSVKQLVEYIAEHYPSAVFNLPPEPVQKHLAREGA